MGLPKLLYVTAACGVLGSPSAGAQDVLLIRVPTEISTPRSLSLGGALVGLGGDASSLMRNPASLVAVPRSLDVVVAPVGSQGGHGYGAAMHPYRTLAIGVQVATADRRVELIAPKASDVGMLLPKDGRRVALAVAWTPPIDRRISIGAAIEAEHLSLVDAFGRETRPKTAGNVTFGVFVQPDGTDGTRVGASYRRGMDRTFEVMPGGLGSAPYANYRVRRPDVLAFGASWRYGWFRNTHVTFTVQPEIVWYSSVLGSPVGNELDLRGGMEVSRPMGSCVSGCGGMWQVRAGLVSRSGIPTLVPTFADGYDPGRRTTTVVLGASIAPERPFSGKVKLDFGYARACDSLGENCNAWMAGLSVRFPSAYRGDLQHLRVRR
jgi:hypothetical protein